MSGIPILSKCQCIAVSTGKQCGNNRPKDGSVFCHKHKNCANTISSSETGFRSPAPVSSSDKHKLKFQVKSRPAPKIKFNLKPKYKYTIFFGWRGNPRQFKVEANSIKKLQKIMNTEYNDLYWGDTAISDFFDYYERNPRKSLSEIVNLHQAQDLDFVKFDLKSPNKVLIKWNQADQTGGDPRDFSNAIEYELTVNF